PFLVVEKDVDLDGVTDTCFLRCVPFNDLRDFEVGLIMAELCFRPVAGGFSREFTEGYNICLREVVSQRLFGVTSKDEAGQHQGEPEREQASHRTGSFRLP